MASSKQSISGGTVFCACVIMKDVKEKDKRRKKKNNSTEINIAANRGFLHLSFQ
jgi:hypothetical protein